MKNLNVLDWIAIAILFVGGLNWGLVGFFQINLVEAIFGYMSVISRLIYAIVGIAAIYVFWLSFYVKKTDDMNKG